jgi:cobalamin biosynthesis protein CobT
MDPMASRHLTRLGALAVTSDLDRIASLFQDQHEVLGVPKEYAAKFAYYCDAMSDHVEKHAIKLAESEETAEEGEEGKEGEEKPEGESKTAAKKAETDTKAESVEEKKSSKKAEAEAKAEDDKQAEDKKAGRGKKAQEDETGLSVDHGESGYDANAIADKKSGPQEIITPPVEGWMAGHFTQINFQQLRDKQEGGDIGFFVSASKARLLRLAAMSALSDLADALTMLHAKLAASDMSEIKGLAGDVKKQADAVSKLRDLSLVQQATGLVEPEVVIATDKVVQAVTEQIPYLKEVVAGVDGSSPVALLEFQKMVGGGSLKELVSLGASIVADAVKGVGKKEEAAKEASKKAEETEAKAEEEKKEASKKAEETPEVKAEEAEEVEEEKKEASKKAEEEVEEEVEKTAFVQKYGYDLFAR